ncbi:hypothetical protein ACOMHN_038421 [Nucella lapillus]
MGDKVEDLKKQAAESNVVIANLRQRLNTYKKNGIERMLYRKEEKLKTLKAKFETTAKHAEQCETYYKSELRKLQLKHADTKFQLKKTKKKMQKKEEEAQQAALQPEEEVAHAEAEIPVIRLKDEQGHFKPEAKVLIISLIGECEVPAHRCGPVIKNVIRQIGGARVPDSDLPSQRSALRFVDQGHVISKAHVAERLLHTDHWDLHTDGTTRNGFKYVCHQITTTGGSLSLGFAPVATEDTTTLVELTIQILEEISDLYPEAEAQQNFVQMLHGLSGIMTDRASVMKSFGRSLEEERRVLLQTDEGLNFLHCNAHFLLGLGAECKKVLGQEEKDGGERLGRDSLPRFNSYSKNTEC